uniref:ARAD1D02838p n=1 Tax=Blastobotrys adeninivorans TaxID=409370 RepID=A0A060TCW9_BLAAD
MSNHDEEEPRVEVKETSSTTEDTDLAEAQKIKEQGNTLFKDKEYQLAIECYERALTKFPVDSKEQLAMCYANIGACYFQLEQYQESVDSSTKAIELNPRYIKARLRRSNANEKLDTWASLEACMADLNYIVTDDDTEQSLKNTVAKRMELLSPRVQEHKEKETGEMLNKFKDLGNGLLKNFGMSLDNFKFEKNEEGGYSVKMK